MSDLRTRSATKKELTMREYRREQLYERTADEPEVADINGPHFPMWAPHGLHASRDAANDSLIDSKNDTFDDDYTDSVRYTREAVPKCSDSLHVCTDLKGDHANVALLLFLYLLQGIPLGLTSSIPLILQSRHISYGQQAMFSFAYWPFSLKLLWAPIVDAVFWSRIGRRKSWLVPTQYLIGIFMLVLSQHVTNMLGDNGVKSTNTSKMEDDKTLPLTDSGPDVLFLTGIFFAFNFLAATQDIAVDGWALTMLSEKNVGYASTCNAVGQTAGFFIGNVVFLALESAEFCNNYLRSTPSPQGIVTLSDFVYYWGWIFLITTTLVLFIKRENKTIDERVNSRDEKLDNLSIFGTYRLLWDIIRLKPVIQLVIMYLTCKIAFAAADGITGLKLIELGVPKDRLAFIAIPLVPLQIVLPWIIGYYTAGPYPLRVYLAAYPFRIWFGVIFAAIVWWTPSWRLTDGHFPLLYYFMITVAYMLQQVVVYSCYVATMAFTAKVSDPIVGGTYMTLLNTVANLGGNWPITLSLSIIDDLTWKYCSSVGDGESISCTEDKTCTSGGKCVTHIDGYYLLCVFCTLFGFIWLWLMRNRVDKLHNVPKKDWSCVKDVKTLQRRRV